MAYKLIPAYVAEYQLVRQNGRSRHDLRWSTSIQKNRFARRCTRPCRSWKYPAKREDIKIVANKSMVKISLDYTVPVDLLVYHIDLHFTPESENKSIV